jgi:hypothetical protein
MVRFYQDALSESVKTLLNSEAQLQQYVIQLGNLKVKKLSEQIIGREFPIHALLSSRKTYDGEYEATGYKAVHIDICTEKWDLLNKVKENGSLLTLSIAFLRDPSVIINSKQKLTDKEKEILRSLKRYYNINPKHNATWFSGSEVIKLGRNLSDLKHHIYATVELSWNYSLEKLLSSSYLTNGIRAEQNLTI